jgi:hypothetical protein
MIIKILLSINHKKGQKTNKKHKEKSTGGRVLELRPLLMKREPATASVKPTPIARKPEMRQSVNLN